MKSGINSVLLTLTFSLLGGCAAPYGKDRADAFREKFPDHLQTYSAPSRKIQFAWTGDPSLPPLIFVHGSPGDWTAWADFLLNADLQKRFHVIAVDRNGYSGSGAGESEGSLKVQAADLIGALAFNKSGKPAILVGHSYGGAVIAQMATDFPDQISTVIFVASSVDPDLEKTKWYQYPASWWPFKYLVPQALRVCNEEIFQLKPELEKLRPRWSEIKAQVASIQGEADDLVPLANQDFILRQIPAVQVYFRERVPGMNHFVPWQHPELILNAIQKASP